VESLYHMRPSLYSFLSRIPFRVPSSVRGKELCPGSLVFFYREVHHTPDLEDNRTYALGRERLGPQNLSPARMSQNGNGSPGLLPDNTTTNLILLSCQFPWSFRVETRSETKPTPTRRKRKNPRSEFTHFSWRPPESKEGLSSSKKWNSPQGLPRSKGLFFGTYLRPFRHPSSQKMRSSQNGAGLGVSQCSPVGTGTAFVRNYVETQRGTKIPDESIEINQAEAGCRFLHAQGGG